jgi:N-acetylmuramoyl-L-alanine amidase
LILEADTALVDALVASPNVGKRQGCERPSILLLHYTGVATMAKAVDWLTRAGSGVSCHYAVDEAGRITQMVAEVPGAWHAGEASGRATSTRRRSASRFTTPATNG